MPSKNIVSVQLQIISKDPVANLYIPQPTLFGLRNRSRTNILPAKKRSDGLLQVDYRLEAKPIKDTPRFLGVYIHGKPKTQYLELVVCYEHDPKEWIWREKISLSDINWEQIVRMANRKGLLQTWVD